MAAAQIENAQAVQAQREALLAAAEIDLERTRIRSPIDGVVIERAVDRGQTVAASFSAPVLFRIAQDLTAIRLEADVDEADIGNVAAGNPVRFTVDAFPDATFDGTVDQVRLAPKELNNVVTYTVIVAAANPDRRLLPGMTAIVEIVTGQREDALRVPNEAVRFRPPEGWEPARDAAAARSPAGDGEARRRAFDLDELAGRLGLDEKQTAAIRGDLRDQLQAMRGGMPPGGPGSAGAAAFDGDPEARRERFAALRDRFREVLAEVLRRHLTAEQFAAYEALARSAAESRPARLWVQADDGTITPVPVRLGISDDRYTEVLTDRLRVGQPIVTRVRRDDRAGR